MIQGGREGRQVGNALRVTVCPRTRRNVDKNSNGAIDFNEFIEMMLRRDSKVEEDVVHAFRYRHIFFLYKRKGLSQKMSILAEWTPI